MKQLKLTSAIAVTFVMIIAIILVSGCKKTTDYQTSIVDNLNRNSEKLVSDIIVFKEMMEYYRENPNLKDGIKIPSDTAILSLEGLINYSYCNTNAYIKEAKIYSSQVVMPLDELLKISASELAALYYSEVIDSIQNQMMHVNATNRELIAVDIKLEEINSGGDAILVVSSFIANTGVLNIGTNEEGWWWGELEGDCQHSPGTDGLMDATTILTTELNKYIINDPPPPGYKWKYVEILIEGPLEPKNYPNEDDDTEFDNHQDYLIYYATTNYTPLTQEVKCISTDAEIGFNLEMGFYLSNYDIIGNNIAANNGGNEVSFLVESLYSYIPPPNEEEILQHNLTVLVGKRYLVPADEELTDLDIMGVE